MNSGSAQTSVGSPLCGYEQARREQLEAFGRTSHEERVEWLGEMLEVMRLAREARRGGSEPPYADAHRQSTDSA